MIGILLTILLVLVILAVASSVFRGRRV